jgi:amidohydrolase
VREFGNAKVKKGKMNKLILDTIEKKSDLLIDLSKKIHSSPELGFDEKKACRWQIDLLKKLGFKVTSPFAGMKTAFAAQKGGGEPRIAFLSEYDALPELGHACGHNLIAPCSIGAAEAFALSLKKENLSGTTLVYGTPAEEGKGGKLNMVSKGIFREAGLVLMAHPSPVTSGWGGFLAIRRFKVEFFGRASHAAASPEKGLNALDANLLLFQGINAFRQHIMDKSRIHGIIENGGSVPNIIPEYSSSSFYLRSPTEKYLKQIVKKFGQIVKGAAMMTGTKFKICEGVESYKAGLVVEALNREFLKIAKELKMKRIEPGRDGMGSSDFGDVSRRAPGLHAYFSISDKDCPLHSKNFEKNANSRRAFDSMLKASAVLANIALNFCSNTKFRTEVISEFKKNIRNCS